MLLTVSSNSNFITNCIDIFIKYRPSFLLGIKYTLIIALTGTCIGLILGLFVGGLKAIKVEKQASSSVKVIKKIYDVISTIYIEFFGGTPMMIQAMFIYYALLKVFNWTPEVAGIFIVSVNTGAYMSEIIRSGIQSVDNGQVEAARSLGMSSIQTMFSVVLPQAIKNAFPAIGNEFIVNIKDSSVLSIISVTDLMFQTKRIGGSTFKYPEASFVALMIYLVITLITSLILRQVEAKINHVNTSIPQSDTNISSINLAKGKDK